MKIPNTPLFPILVFICLFFYEGQVHAQSQFQPGYVVKVLGDTIFGLIDNQEWQLSQQICVFKSSKTAERVTYTPNDIAGYQFTDGKFYISKEFKGKQLFFEYIIKGKLNIYFILRGKTRRYFMDKDNVSLLELSYKEGIKTVNDKRYQYKTTTHIGLLTYYTQEATALDTKIAEIKTPRHKNLISLAKDYHQAVCDDEVCIVYEKRVLKFKAYLEPIVGYHKYLFWDAYSTVSGANLVLWIPGSYERFYIKTGMNFISNTDNRELYRIPFQVQYIYPGKRWKPKAGGGLHVYMSTNVEIPNRAGIVSHSYNLHAGLNFEISKGLILSSTFNTDYVPFIYGLGTESKFLFYGLNVGLFIRII